MESEWETEIRELLDSLAREPLDELLKEIAEAPIPFIDYQPIPKARRTLLYGSPSLAPHFATKWQSRK